MLADGSIAYDGKANLYDENGNLIYKTESKGLEGSLVEILYGKNATEKQVDNIRNLMDKNLSHYTIGDDENNKDNWYWNGNVINENMDKQISGQTIFDKYGNSIVPQAFAYNYDSSIDGLYATVHGIDIGSVDMKIIPLSSLRRFMNLYSAKSNFYNSADALFESDDTKISGPYGDYIRNKDGTLKDNYQDYYKNYNNLHYGIDIVKYFGSDNLLLGLSGQVEKNFYDKAEGWTVQFKYGYKFEDTYISTGIYGEYGHLLDQSTLINDTFYNSTNVVGLYGNTGEKSTGSHLHYSVYTTNQFYSDSTMRILLGKNYQVGSMYNGSWRTVYNPTSFFERYK